MQWVTTVMVPAIITAVKTVIATVVWLVQAFVALVVEALNQFASLIIGSATTLSPSLAKAIAYTALALMITGLAGALLGSDSIMKVFDGLTVLFLVLTIFAALSVGTWIQGLIFALGVLTLMFLGLFAIAKITGQDDESLHNPANRFKRQTADSLRQAGDFARGLVNGGLGLPNIPTWAWWLIGGTITYIVFIKE